MLKFSVIRAAYKKADAGLNIPQPKLVIVLTLSLYNVQLTPSLRPRKKGLLTITNDQYTNNCITFNLINSYRQYLFYIGDLEFERCLLCSNHNLTAIF